jgi:hypothetical protein
MKLFEHAKDGGPLSHTEGFFLTEIKSLFSIALLRFSDGTRDAYHSHAFNAVSWVIRGKLVEHLMGEEDDTITAYVPSWRPIWTPRSRFHKVFSVGTTWVITFRGPWVSRWQEYDPSANELSVLTNGRKVVSVRASGFSDIER